MKNKILLIDDDTKIIAALKNFLQQSGYRIIEAYNGAMGYKFLQEEKPDLIIIDMLIPGIAGLELCRKIKENPDYSKIPVLLMTEVYKKLTYKLEAKRYGCDAFIEKPIDFKELIKIIKKYLPASNEIKVSEEELFNVELAIITEEFIQELPKRFQELEKILSELILNENNSEKTKEIYKIIHSLCGTAGTFNLITIYEVAHSFLKLLNEIIENKIDFSQEHHHKFNEYITQMKESYHNLLKKNAEEIAEKKHFEKESKLLADERKNQSINPLIVLFEKDEILAEEICNHLRHFEYTAMNSFSTKEMEKFLNENAVLAVIFDLNSYENADDFSGIMNSIYKGSNKKIPIIFLTDKDNFYLRLKAIRSGAETVIEKPVDYDILVEKLDSLNEASEAAYRILIVEDESLVSSFYQSIFEEAGMESKVVENPFNILEDIIQFKPDLILLDIYMPEINGIEVASIIRQYKAFENIPIVYLSTETNINKQLYAMNKGGDDFLIKPIKKEYLLASVINRIRRSHNLKNLIIKDSLTGLLNYSAIKEQLENEISIAMRLGTHLSFAMIDIDNFKSINDTYGHLFGDKILKSLALLLKKRLRKTDFIGRYGGDEFALIFPDTPLSKSILILEELKASFSKINHLLNNQKFNFTFSGGIVEFKNLSTCKEIINLADQALYEAKNQGKNKIKIKA